MPGRVLRPEGSAATFRAISVRRLFREKRMQSWNVETLSATSSAHAVVFTGAATGVHEMQIHLKNGAIPQFIPKIGDIAKKTNGKVYYKVDLSVLACWYGVLC